MSIDTLAGVYVWCTDHHRGQWSREYRLLSRIARRGLVLRGGAHDAIRYGGGEWEAAHAVYRRLCASMG